MRLAKFGIMPDFIIDARNSSPFQSLMLILNNLRQLQTQKPKNPSLHLQTQTHNPINATKKGSDSRNRQQLQPCTTCTTTPEPLGSTNPHSSDFFSASTSASIHKKKDRHTTHASNGENSKESRPPSIIHNTAVSKITTFISKAHSKSQKITSHAIIHHCNLHSTQSLATQIENLNSSPA